MEAAETMLSKEAQKRHSKLNKEAQYAQPLWGVKDVESTSTIFCGS
jgi:hypothetical protein